MARSEDEKKKKSWTRARIGSGVGVGIESLTSRLVRLLAWMPPWLRPRDGGDEEKDLELTWGLTVIYAMVRAFFHIIPDDDRFLGVGNLTWGSRRVAGEMVRWQLLRLSRRGRVIVCVYEWISERMNERVSE